MDKKKIMILGASELQLPAIKKAKEMDLFTIVVDMDKNAIGKKYSDVFYPISTLDYINVLKVAQDEKIDGIMTICSDRPMPIIALVGEKLGLNTISYETSLKATNKALMRKVLQDKNVPIPKFYICNDYASVERAVKLIGKKVIIKPSDNSGSRGIHIYDGEGNLKSISDYTFKYSSNNCVLVEEYMQGSEVSVETFSIDGIVHVIQVTDKITTEEPYFVELGHIEPSLIGGKLLEDIKKVAIQAVKAIGITEGPAHVEIKVTSDGPKIVELGARLGGDHITTDLVPLSTGVNMVEANICMSLNQKPNLNITKNKGACIMFFNPPIGKIKNISGLDFLKKDKIEYKLMVGIGDRIKSIKSSNDRVGYIITHEENAYKSKKKCEQYMKLVKFEVENENIDI